MNIHIQPHQETISELRAHKSIATLPIGGSRIVIGRRSPSTPITLPVNQVAYSTIMAVWGDQPEKSAGDVSRCPNW